MAKTLLVNTTTAVAANGTFIAGMGAGTGAASELTTEYAASHGVQFSNMRKYILSGGSGNNTSTFRKNSANGNLTATRVGTGAASDLVHTDSLVSGDIFDIALTSDGTDPVNRVHTMNMELTGAHGSFFRAGTTSAVTLSLASTNRFAPIGGSLFTNLGSSESAAQWRNRIYTLADAFQVRIEANARLNDTVFVLRVNGVTVAASTITVAAGTTGLFLVTGINQALAAGDLISVMVTTGTGTESISINSVGATLLSSANGSELFAAQSNTVSRAASATPDYMVLGGNPTFISNDLTGMSVTPGFAADIKNLRIRCHTNTTTTDQTLTLFVNGVSSGMTVTVTAATTGWFENTIDKVNITANDSIVLQLVGGGTNSCTVSAFGVTLAVPTPINPSVTSKPRLTGGGIGGGPKRRNFAWPLFSIIDHD